MRINSKTTQGTLIGWFAVLLMASMGYAQPACTESYGAGPNNFSLATGSPGELGLLKALADEFARKNNTTLCWVKAGSGESMKFLKDKQVDMIMVHAPAAEKKAVEDGWATRRVLIGSNEFFIVGPPEDPAGIKKAKTAAEAYALIANGKSKFFSRGDNSGTHKKEMKNMAILFRGDVFLVNTYHTLLQPEGATPGQKFASQFIDFVSSAEGQKIIATFGKDLYGEGIYNDAAYAKQYDK